MSFNTEEVYTMLIKETSTGASIIQSGEHLQARCKKCLSYIAWSGSFWYCANADCRVEMIKVGVEARVSVIKIFDWHTPVIARWIAEWIGVPVSDVSVVISK